MKQSALIFILFFWGQRAFGQSPVDTPQIATTASMNLAGNVDSIAELTLDVQVALVDATLQVNADSGNKIITVPDTLLTVKEERAWKFDEKGRLLNEVLRKAQKRLELEEVQWRGYEYKKGKIAREVVREETKLSDSIVYKYAGGKLSMMEKYDGRGRYTGRTQFFQNKEKLLSTISHKNADLELIDMTKLWYSPGGELTSITLHDENQRLITTKKYEVNKDSLDRLHVMIFDYAKPDTCTGMVSYVLDDAGNHVEDVVQDEKGNVKYYSTVTCNDKSHPAEAVIFTDRKQVINYKYDYDDQQNWILKRIFIDGEPKTFVKRTIFYRK
jgi:hypothetical protein